MTDIREHVALSDAEDIGFKIAEMCDAVKLGAKFAPGCVADWGLEIDGIRYCVKVTLE